METRILLWVHGCSTPALDGAFRVSHVLGALPFCTLLVVAAALWHLAHGERREALVWVAVGLTTFGIQELIKPLVARARPELWPRIVAQSGFSFPSGHAVASAAFYPLLAWEAARRRHALAALGYAASVAMALYIGVGRLYLGVHWPTDVLGGWTLGALQSLVAIRWLMPRGGESGKGRDAAGRPV